MNFCPHHFFQSATRHWAFQRLTALLLIPLSGWLLLLFQLLFKSSYPETLAWLAKGINCLAISLWLLLVCIHAILGIQVILEDYVSDFSWRSRLNIINHVWFSLIAVSGLFTLQFIFWHGAV